MPSNHLPAPHGPAILTTGDFRAAIAPIMPVLTRYARRLATTAADTDDLVQDTLLKAWTARTSFRPGSNLRAWLMRIARNTFLSSRRRGARQVPWEPEAVAQALITGTEQEDAMMLDDLTTAVAALPVPQRRAFELVAVENLSYADAAGRLGVELGTLKGQVSRARAALVRTIDTIPQPLPGGSATVKPADTAVRRNVYATWKASGVRLIGVPQEPVAA